MLASPRRLEKEVSPFRSPAPVCVDVVHFPSTAVQKGVPFPRHKQQKGSQIETTEMQALLP